MTPIATGIAIPRVSLPDRPFIRSARTRLTLW